MYIEAAYSPPSQRSTKKAGAVTHDISGCAPARDVLTRLGDKWSMLIVILLGDGALRFNELKRQTDGITQRMLSLTLKSLERDGIVLRSAAATLPPNVSYTLTPLGFSLWSVVKSVGQWASENHARIEIARTKFDTPTAHATPEHSSHVARLVRF
jgi:DNA-binding HxlR family transcriptional regulator